MLGFEATAAAAGTFDVILMTPDLALDLLEHAEPAPRHLAVGMDRATFEAIFERIRTSGALYGDGPATPTSLRGPGRSLGVHEATDSVYLHDPNGPILEMGFSRRARVDLPLTSCRTTWP